MTSAPNQPSRRDAAIWLAVLGAVGAAVLIILLVAKGEKWGGFLGNGAPFWVDFNLVAQIILAAALVAGAVLARSRRYVAHRFLQSSVVLLNLVFIAAVMVPSFHGSVVPGLPSHFSQAYYRWATIHAGLGTITELLALYVISVAGTNWVPAGLRFRNYKPWMRTTLALWIVTLGFGIWTYHCWYATGSSVPLKAAKATVIAKNFTFVPKIEHVSAGTTVTWFVQQGPHTVTSDSGVFDSGNLNTGQKFRFTFTKPGVYKYHCDYHVSMGMVGEVIVG
jgi:plastocyanin